MKKFSIAVFLMISVISTVGYGKEKVTVLLDWFANPNHAPLIIAKEKGFFSRQGLTVELISPSDPADPPKLIAAKKADIAITYQPQFFEQVDQGLPLIRMGTLIAQPLNCLVVLKESPITTIRDLKGKRVGYSTGGISSVALEVMLEKNHLKPSDVHRINVHYSITQALLSGKIDAVTGMLRNFELIQLELMGHPARAFYPEQNGMPSYSELIFVIHQDSKQAGKFRKFLYALKEGVQYLQSHPRESWEIFSKSNPALNDPLNSRAFFNTIQYFEKDPEKIDSKKWIEFSKFMYNHALIKKIQPLERYSLNLLKE